MCERIWTQLALPFEGRTLYFGYCAMCWSEELIDGPHLVGLCAQCRESENDASV